jgi:hypothetical protein
MVIEKRTNVSYTCSEAMLPDGTFRGKVRGLEDTFILKSDIYLTFLVDGLTYPATMENVNVRRVVIHAKECA